MALLLEISNVSKSLYYYHLSSIPYLEKNKDIVSKIIEIFEKSNKTYGYRRVSAALKKEYKTVNHKKVLKIMNLLGLKPSIKRRKNILHIEAMLVKNLIIFLIEILKLLKEILNGLQMLQNLKHLIINCIFQQS